MVAALLKKGTRTMTREQLQDRLDQLKTEVSIGSSPGQVRVHIVSRHDPLPAAIALVGEMLRTPSFPAEALDEVKRQALAGIEQQRKQPEAVAQNAVARASNPYPRGDVRHAPTFDEMVADVNEVTADKVRAFHARFYGARKGEFAAVGDFDPAAVRQALASAFGDWNAGMPYTRVPQPLVPLEPERLMLAVPDNQNATMLVRLDLPLSDNDPDYAALTMANYLLGSGGNSRLWKRVREGEGLSYDVRSRVAWSSIEPHSEWMASAIFAPQNQAKVEKAFKEELARALKDGFTAKELAEGQRGLLSFRRLSRAQDARISGAWVSNLYLGRTFQRSAEVDKQIAGLSVDDVNTALRKYLKPEQVVSVFAGDFKP
jgi:zinc protease